MTHEEREAGIWKSGHEPSGNRLEASHPGKLGNKAPFAGRVIGMIGVLSTTYHVRTLSIVNNRHGVLTTQQISVSTSDI